MGMDLITNAQTCVFVVVLKTPETGKKTKTTVWVLKGYINKNLGTKQNHIEVLSGSVGKDTVQSISAQQKKHMQPIAK